MMLITSLNRVCLCVFKWLTHDDDSELHLRTSIIRDVKALRCLCCLSLLRPISSPLRLLDLHPTAQAPKFQFQFPVEMSSRPSVGQIPTLTQSVVFRGTRSGRGCG